ncbi:MAG: hydroxymethylglutaryl-CoA lyase [Moraxellaceae bacterium]|nr:MAG: hydroxymethylglutaryl-CoA lyase [Moraxellaceae bacterium]
MSGKVVITEVGLRDGLQNQPNPVSTQQKLAMADALIQAGITHIEATSFVHPKWVPQMADAADVMAGFAAQQRQNLNISVFVPNMKGYQLAKLSGANSVGVVVATTDSFNLKNMNMTTDEAATVCEQVIEQAKIDGIQTRAYIAGSCVCPYEGKMPIEVTLNLAERMIATGADEISIADTVGGGNPQQIIDILTPLIQQYGPDRFSLHLHDTRGQALAMAWAGLTLGIRRFDSSIGGLGGCPFAPGASGNVATEDLVYMLEEAGFNTGIQLDKLKIAIEVAAQATGQSLGGSIYRWMLSQEKRQQHKASTEPRCL